jgi:hypothetical protein
METPDFKINIELHGLYDYNNTRSRYRITFSCSCHCDYVNKLLSKSTPPLENGPQLPCACITIPELSGGTLHNYNDECIDLCGNSLLLDPKTYKTIEKIVTGNKKEMILNLKNDDLFIALIARLMLKKKIGTVRKVI